MDGLRLSAKALSDGKMAVQLAEDMARAVRPDALRSVADAGGEVIASKAASIVSTTAKHPTGTLAGAIKFRSWADATGAGALIGWEKVSVKRSHGVRGRHSYRTASGRGRSVNTVADYAGILEYSQRRQLRHMGPAWEQAEEEALNKMESRLDELLDQAGF